MNIQTHISRTGFVATTLERTDIDDYQILQCSVFDVQCSLFKKNGSSAFLTDISGIPTQIPTPLSLRACPALAGKGAGGEVFWAIEQHSVTDYYTPYTFSAKERDLETGYSYFGARYYNSDISVWLSI